jgi:hypothetical protein
MEAEFACKKITQESANLRLPPTGSLAGKSLNLGQQLHHPERFADECVHPCVEHLSISTYATASSGKDARVLVVRKANALIQSVPNGRLR